jgi:glycosyltransferase involved in cell wall biosynthesis
MSSQVGSRRVTVVVPAYKVTNFIADALESLRAQTYRDFETIVVNDGCPDTERLEAVLRPYASEIRYLKQENGGVASARNAAVRVSDADYIALLDADDVWEPDYLEEQVRFLQTHPEFDVVYPDATLFGDPATTGLRYMELVPSTGEVTLESLLTGTCNVFISVMASREMVVRAGLFDPNLRAAEDFDLWLRILLTGGRIGYHRKVLARRRKHDASLSADKVVQTRRGLIVLRKLLEDPRLPPASAGLVRETIGHFAARAELWEGKRALVDHRSDEAAEHFARANEYFQSTKLRLITGAVRVAPSLVRRLYARRQRA